MPERIRLVRKDKNMISNMTKQEAVRLYDMGNTYNEVANTLSVNIKTIYRWFKKLGVEARNTNDYRSKTIKVRKIRVVPLSEKNPNWKGESVTYAPLHAWVKRHFILENIPKECASCGKDGKLDLANISGEYKRDLSDWKYLCRRCHMLEDGRMSNLKQFSRSQI